jgi:hypothetical protein
MLFVNIHRSSCNVPVILCHILMKLVFSWQIFQKILKCKICWKSVKWEPIVPCGRTDRRADCLISRNDLLQLGSNKLVVWTIHVIRRPQHFAFYLSHKFSSYSLCFSASFIILFLLVCFHLIKYNFCRLNLSSSWFGVNKWLLQPGVKVLELTDLCVAQSKFLCAEWIVRELHSMSYEVQCTNTRTIYVILLIFSVAVATKNQRFLLFSLTCL